MARPLRIELAGGLYHLTARGDGREDIYFDEVDRLAWLAVLGEVCERFRWRVHAWCQMTNHYHLVAETPEPNLAEGMRHLNGVYTQAINRRYGRVGHVFQGRYKAVLVERDGGTAVARDGLNPRPVFDQRLKGPGSNCCGECDARKQTEPGPFNRKLNPPKNFNPFTWGLPRGRDDASAH